jgi:hypothetical protein
MLRHQFKKPHKYGAEETIVDGIKFPSKLEARYYSDLKLRVRSGEVLFFLRQVPLHLAGTRMVIDFQEFHADGTVHFVDTKGYETKEFKRNVAQAKVLYPHIEIELVTKLPVRQVLRRK